MFTGLVHSMGKVTSCSVLDEGTQLTIHTPQLKTLYVTGDSIAVNGVCSTATQCAEDAFQVDYLPETLNKTTIGTIKEGDHVNLELSLTPSSRLGGHFVTGHVDDTGLIKRLKTTDTWGEIEIEIDSKWDPFLIPKGSICIDGMSLTVVDVGDKYFTCHLIPHTIHQTVLQYRREGDKVNLEFDLLGKYVHKFYTTSANSQKKES